jgi:hypothetical protein
MRVPVGFFGLKTFLIKNSFIFYIKKRRKARKRAQKIA